MKTFVKKIPLFVFFLLSLAAAANGQAVNSQNGNFYATFTDYSDNRTGGLTIERTFNSKSDFFGSPMGACWAQTYLYFVVPMPSGIIVMHCKGGGDTKYFVPENLPEAEVDEEIRLILDAKIAEGSLKTDAEIDLQRKHLKDLGERNREYIRLLQKGKLPPVTLPVGHRGIYNHQSLTNIIVTGVGYEARLFEKGEEAGFNRLGKLTWYKDEKGETQIRYDTLGNLDQITHSDGTRLKVKCDRRGRIVNIWNDRGYPVSYKYNGVDALIWSKDSQGNICQYEYDNNLNLSRIRYEDSSDWKIVYHPNDLYPVSTTNRNKSRNIYNYGEYEDGHFFDHYYTEVNTITPEGDTISFNRYEYKVSTDTLTGSRYRSEKTDIINRTDTTVYVYLPNGLISEYKKNGESIRFYQSRENIATKIETGSGKKYLLDYDKEGKLASITEPGVGRFQLFRDSLDILTHLVLPDGRKIPYPAADLVEFRDAGYKSLSKLMELSDSFGNWFNCDCMTGKVKCQPANSNGGLSDYKHIVENIPYVQWPNHADYFKCISQNSLIDSLKKPYMAAAAKLLRSYIERKSFAKAADAEHGKMVLYYLLSGQYGEALAWIEKIRANKPDNPWAARYEPLAPLLQGHWEEASAGYEKYADRVVGRGHPDFFKPKHYARWDMREVYLEDIEMLERGRYLAGDMVEKAQTLLRTDADWGRFYANKADTTADAGPKTELYRLAARYFEKAYRQRVPDVLYLLLLQHEHLGNGAPETAFTPRSDRESLATLAEYYRGRAERTDEPNAKRACFGKSSGYYARLCALDPAAPERMDWIDAQEALSEKPDYGPLFALRDVETLYAFTNLLLDKAGEHSASDPVRSLRHSWWALDPKAATGAETKDTVAFAAADSLRHNLYSVLAAPAPDTGSAARFERYFQLMKRFLKYTEKDTLKRNYRISLYLQKVVLLERLQASKLDEVKREKDITEAYGDLKNAFFEVKDYQAYYEIQLKEIQRAERNMKQYPADDYFKKILENRNHDAALACFYLHQLDKALEYSKKVVLSNLDESNYFYANGRIVYAYLLSGRYDEAVAYFEKVKELQDEGKSMADNLSENMNLYLERTGTNPNNPDVKRFLEYLKGQK